MAYGADNADTARTKPGELSGTESSLRAAFLSQVDRIPGGDRLRRCIQCGTCSGTCPVSYAMDVQPRQIVGYFRAGDLESILNSRTIWLCASCYSCTVRCPAHIKVTDLIYGLKRMAMEHGLHGRGRATSTLAERFAALIRRHGRNQEMWLMMQFMSRAAPGRMLGKIGLAWRLWRTGRLAWRADRIRDRAGLRRIIDKAEAMAEMHPQERMRTLTEIGYGAVTETRTSGGAS